MDTTPSERTCHIQSKKSDDSGIVVGDGGYLRSSEKVKEGATRNQAKFRTVSCAPRSHQHVATTLTAFFYIRLVLISDTENWWKEATYEHMQLTDLRR